MAKAMVAMNIVLALINLMSLALLLQGANSASASKAQQGVAAGRKLLAATDNRFQFYTQQYPNQNVMVCKSCKATNLQGATVAGTIDGGFQIFVVDSGIIIRQGEGGLDNWQFRGCFTRGRNQESIVTFTRC